MLLCKSEKWRHAQVRVDDIFTDNPFTRLVASPEEILPARRGLRLLASSRHIS